MTDWHSDGWKGSREVITSKKTMYGHVAWGSFAESKKTSWGWAGPSSDLTGTGLNFN